MVWVIFLFAGTFGFYTTFTREMEQGTINGLRLVPTPSWVILIGKVIYGFILMAILEIVVVPISMAMFNYSFNSHAILILLTFILGTLDLAVAGAIVSGLTMYGESKTILLPLLMFPLVLPVIIPCVVLTGKMIEGITFSAAIPELRIIAFILTVLIVTAILLFDYVLED